MNIAIFESIDSIPRLQVQGSPTFYEDRLLISTPKGIVGAKDRGDGRWVGEEQGPVLAPQEVGSNPILQFEAIPELDLIVTLTKEGLSVSSTLQGKRLLEPLPKTKGAHGFTVDRRKLKRSNSSSNSASAPSGHRLQVFVFSKRRVQVVGLTLQLSETAAVLQQSFSCTAVSSAAVLADVSLKNTPHHLIPLRASEGRLWLVHMKNCYRLVKLEAHPLWSAGRTESISADEGISINLPSGSDPVSCLHGPDQLVIAVGSTLHFTAVPVTHEETPPQLTTVQLCSKPRAILSAAGPFVLAACEASVEVIVAHKTFGCYRVQELFYPNVSRLAASLPPLPPTLALLASSAPAPASPSLTRPSFSGFYSSAASSKPETVNGSIEILIRRPAEDIIGDLENAGDFDSAMDLVPLLVEDPSSRSSLLQSLRARYASHLLQKDSLPEALLYLSSAFPDDPFPLLGLLQPFSGLAFHDLEFCAKEGGFSAPLHPTATGPLRCDSSELHLALSLCLPYLYSYRTRLQFKAETAVKKAAVLLDTALLNILVEAGDFEGCFQLCGQENCVDIEKSAPNLRGKGLFIELVELYRKTKNHVSALELLRQITIGDTNLDSPPAGRSRDLFGPPGARLIADYLLSINHPSSPSLPSPPSSSSSDLPKEKGEKEKGGVGEVERLHLVLKYSETIAAVCPEAALELFAKLDPPLPPRRVVDHLRQCQPSLCVPFLEKTIERLGPVAHTEFDQELALLLLEGAHSSASNQEKLRQLLLTSLQLKLDILAPKLAAAKGMEEEHAIVLIRSGKPADAFTLLVWSDRLDSGLEKAEKWCGYFSAPSSRHLTPSEGENLWTTLLEVLLKPELGRTSSGPPSASKLTPRGATKPSPSPASASKPLPSQALQFLYNHGHDMDPLVTLGLIPDGVSFASLVPYLERLIPSLGEQTRALAAKKALLRIEELRLRAEICRIEKSRVVVSYDRACIRCNKRIGLSAFAVKPNGELIHLQCGGGN